MILNDREIRHLAFRQGMIDPFYESRNESSGPSSGLSSFGYDMRLAPELHIFPETWVDYAPSKREKPYAIDPIHFDETIQRAIRIERPKPYPYENDPEVLILPPNAFALARSIEYFRLPDDIFALVTGKSTYARCGLEVTATPAEPGWEGHLTLELKNLTNIPLILYPDRGIAQMIFFRGNDPDSPYWLRSAKYQGQTGVTYARG